MKRSDSGDFCVFYVEPDDEKSALFQKIQEQKKPIVLMLAEQAHVFQRPEDFAELKHIRRHLDMPILFVASGSERLVHLAGRHGFPVYLSMDALMNALKMGQVGKQRGVARKTFSNRYNKLGSGQHESPTQDHGLTAPDSSTFRRAAMPRKTIPLLAETWGEYEHIVGARFIAPTVGNTPPRETQPRRGTFQTPDIHVPNKERSRPKYMTFPTRNASSPRHALPTHRAASTLDTIPELDAVPTRPLLSDPLPQAKP